MVRLAIQPFASPRSHQILGPGYTSRRRTASPFPYKLVTVTATDHDAGTNGQLTYFLLSGNSLLFSVDPNTGIVYVLQNLLYSVAPSYTIQVGARSGGGAQTNRSLNDIVIMLKRLMPI